MNRIGGDVFFRLTPLHIEAEAASSSFRAFRIQFEPLLTEVTIRFLEDGGEAVGRKIDSTEFHP